MGRAESLKGKMSSQDPSDLWSRSDGETELLQDLGWYHSNLTRHAAEALLLSNGCDGSYLLRDSNERIGLYSLSVRAKDSVKHFHVEYTGYSFKFGFNEFSSLKDFVKHFANQPLIGSETAGHQGRVPHQTGGPGQDLENKMVHFAQE
uniref:Dual adaptor of phosphotyrosine and 3-phosphoinositides 1 n=1 Tax=Equus caballus TaxID=9796 RepID=A0A9L0TMZ4_HORSE